MQNIRHTFKREERLKSRKIIADLFESGHVIHSHPLKVLYKLSDKENQEINAQIAVSVSKKSFRQAVSRNRIKRKIREAYRLNKHLLYEKLKENNKLAYLFVIYTEAEDLHFTRIETGIKNFIVKLTGRLS